MSTDNDLFQLLRDNVSMLINNKKPLYTKAKFEQEHQISVHQWSAVKAISGCDSDGIIGVKGVGEKTAIKYLCYELNKTSKAYKEIEGNPELVALNFNLTHLPF